MRVRNTFILLLIMLMLSSVAVSQLSIGVSISGVGYHPTPDTNSHLYKWKLDNKGKVVAFTGLSFVVSYRINDYFGVKAMQTFVFHDCAGKFAGVTHLGVDFHDDIIGWDGLVNQFSASFGPLWYYRKGWSQNPSYVNDPSFMRLSENSVWENKFVWYGGLIEYAHYFDGNYAATINLFPGHPYLYTFGLGSKYTY